ncbi:hypothetical protein U9608_001222 [Vibrio alginolyticus]|nr:hypothetical protein [Vibrio alginolyticus]
MNKQQKLTDMASLITYDEFLRNSEGVVCFALGHHATQDAHNEAADNGFDIARNDLVIVPNDEVHTSILTEHYNDLLFLRCTRDLKPIDFGELHTRHTLESDVLKYWKSIKHA